MRLASVVAPLGLCAGVGCGARTGLDAPLDAPVDASPDVARDAPAGCPRELPRDWRGTITGNAPDVDTTLHLAVAADGTTVTGTLLWQSPVSGTSRRALAGTWSPARCAFVAHDTALLESHPNPPWIFCLVDRYQLTLSPDGSGLTGTYDSSACFDHARVALTRAP